MDFVFDPKIKEGVIPDGIIGRDEEFVVRRFRDDLEFGLGLFSRIHEILPQSTLAIDL